MDTKYFVKVIWILFLKDSTFLFQFNRGDILAFLFCFILTTHSFTTNNDTYYVCVPVFSHILHAVQNIQYNLLFTLMLGFMVLQKKYNIKF